MAAATTTTNVTEFSLPSTAGQPLARTQRRRSMTFVQPQSIPRPTAVMMLVKTATPTATTMIPASPTTTTTTMPGLGQDAPIDGQFPVARLPSKDLSFSVTGTSTRRTSHAQRSKHRPSWSVCTLSTLHEVVGMEETGDIVNGQFARVTSRRLTKGSRRRPLSFDIDRLPLSQPLQHFDSRI